MTKDLQVGNSPFDQAWIVLKAPIYERDYHEFPESLGANEQYEMLPNFEETYDPFVWQSEDGNARGTVFPQDFYNSLSINNFELASNSRGKGKAKAHVKQMIDDAKDYFMERGYNLPGTHVTNVEHSAAGFWDKMVDRGVIDGAHPGNSIRINSAGNEHYTHAYDDKTQPWQHELNPEYAEYHNLEKAYEYHGTVDLPSVLQHGIRGGNPKTRSKRYVPESLRAADLVNYTTTDPEAALRFAQERARRTKQDPSKVGVVRMRTADLPEYVEHQEPDYGDLQGGMSRVRQGSIPPEVLQQWS